LEYPIKQNHAVWVRSVRATIDHGVIDDWWGPGGDYPGCKVGIATGVESGIWVLDIDAREPHPRRVR
jgi:hypothetical protein